MSIRRALPWAALGDLASAHYTVPDVINGPTNPHAHLRLFGKSESDVRVTLFRDKHQWCPYCQKVWLWMEEKRIPYRVQKVTSTPVFFPTAVVPRNLLLESAANRTHHSRRGEVIERALCSHRQA